MTTVERIKEICKERKIPISKLEKECGFANAYISQLKKGHLPDDRIRIVSEYLNVSIDYLQFGEEKEMPTTPLSDEQIRLLELFANARPENQKLALLALEDGQPRS